MKQVDARYSDCPIRNVISHFGDKWSMLVLYTLFSKGTLRFSELQREMLDISQKMLSKTLKRLEQNGLVLRKVYPEVPPRVEYALSDLGKSLIPAMEPLLDWSKQHMISFVQIAESAEVVG
jgi:DNA-binding HxlR family transcriptional regulator